MKKSRIAATTTAVAILLTGVGIAAPSASAAPTDFVSTWDTSLTSTGSTGADSIKLPLLSTGIYNFTVNYGDGTPDVAVTSFNDTDATHTYATPGTYTVTISGTIQGFSFSQGGDLKKIKDISQWGTLKPSGGNQFFNATNLEVTATDAPDLTGVTSLRAMFANTKFNGRVDNWDTSSVTDMSWMFMGTPFNQPIDTWNTSNVTNMNAMFLNDTAFNQPIGIWNVSKVTNMAGMFYGATSFNQPLNAWNTAALNTVYSSTPVGAGNGMFQGATSFNQPIDNWNMSKVTSLRQMFKDATSFNQPLNNWNTAANTNLYHTFYGATSFNQDLNNWNTSNVTSAVATFAAASAFNGNVSTWFPSVSKITNLSYMFSGALAFNQPLANWDVSKVTTFQEAFESADSFNQPLNTWNLAANNISLAGMFQNTDSFNSAPPVITPKVVNMSNMFLNAKAFNKSIAGDASNVTNFDGLLSGATAFSQDLSNIDIVGATTTDMLLGVTIDPAQDATLRALGWAVPLAGATVAAAPLAPSLSVASNVTSDSADFTPSPDSLDNRPDATSYNIYVNGVLYGSATGSFTINDLNAATAYVVTATAVNEFGESTVSASRTVTTLAATAPTAPSAPALPGGAPSDPDSIVISWDAPLHDGGVNVTSYEVYRDGVLIGTVTAPETSFTDSTAPAGSVADYAIIAVNSEGPSTASAPLSVLIPEPSAPDAPTSAPTVDMNQVTDTSAVISWPAAKRNGSDIEKYQIYVNGGLYAETVDGQTLSMEITGLSDSTDYQVSVVAINAIGGGLESASASFRTDGIPATPETVAVSSDADVARVSWVAPYDGDSAITAYQIYRDGVLVGTVNGNVTQFDDTTITAGTAYEYSIVAVNRFGSSDASATIGSVTPDASAPDAPTDLMVDTVSNVSGEISWTASKPNGAAVLRYEVYVDGVLAAIVPSSSGTLDYSVSIPGLQDGAAYDVQVVAINAIGTSAKSNSVVVETNPEQAGVIQIPPYTPVAGETLVSYTVTWVDGYGVTRELTVDPSATAVTIDSLNRDSTYTVGIRANVAQANSNQAAGSETIIVNPVKDDQYVATWTEPTPPSGESLTEYKIYLDGVLLATIPAPATEHTIRGLVGGDTYGLKIDAITDAGTVINVFDQNIVPVDTGSIRGLSTSTSTVDWVEYVPSNADQFVVGYVIKDSDGNIVGTVNAGVTSFEVSGLVIAQSYTYTVEAILGTKVANGTVTHVTAAKTPYLGLAGANNGSANGGGTGSSSTTTNGGGAGSNAVNKPVNTDGDKSPLPVVKVFSDADLRSAKAVFVIRNGKFVLAPRYVSTGTVIPDDATFTVVINGKHKKSQVVKGLDFARKAAASESGVVSSYIAKAKVKGSPVRIIVNW